MNERDRKNSVYRVLIVDDHPVVRHGFDQLISQESDLAVCGTASGSADALRLTEQMHPDLIVIDVSLEDGSGIELIKHLRSRNDSQKMLVASMHDENLFAERALRAGAMGYINKQESAEQLILAIRQVLKGQVYVSSRMAERMLQRMAGFEESITHSPIDTLSDRELEVFSLIGQGLGTRQIAERLHLSVKTIETHRYSIKTKLNLETSNELTRRAVQWTLEEK